MILKNIDNVNLDNFPVVIFGSGPAGITTALELEKKNIKCLIVEAGDEVYSATSQEFFKGKTIGDPITDLSSSRLRQFGGTSGHWGGWSKPMEHYNLELWPLKAQDLNPYLKRTCEILNINNQFRKSSLNEYFNQIEFQYSKVRFASKFKNHIKKTNNILLVLNTQLSHLVGYNNNTDYAECIAEKSRKRIKAKYFILACGGIENSRLLLWTKEKNSGFIDNSLPIGKYWMNHPWVLAGAGIINKKKMEEKLKDNFLKYDGPLHFSSRRELIIKKKILSAAMYMNAKEDTKIYKEIIKDILCVAPEYGKKIARMIFNKDLKCGNIFMHLEEDPNENNKIVLDNKKDKFEIPTIKLFYKKSKETLRTAKLFLEEFGNLCIKENLGRIAIKKKIYNLEEFESMGAYHHMGGTRIGVNKFDSVVDKNLKIHNINNLYISGSSNFVTSGYTNPTFTIIQLAIRLSEKIKERLYT
jgi:hypothetical protein|tara:strand:+ start:5180 stop:6589 length:1410 start_codon:yes stop_codon:yes gene_type:complete